MSTKEEIERAAREEEARIQYEKRQAEEAAAMRSSTAGFWIAAGPMGVADQALCMDLQRARFYPSVLPEGFRQELPRFDDMGKGREKPFEAAFDAAFARMADEIRKEHPEICAKLDQLARDRLDGGTLRDGASCTFLYHQDPQSSHWGALTLGWEDAFFCPEDVEDLWNASDEAKAVAGKLSARCAELMLDECERMFALKPSPLAFASDDWHAFWGADDAPSCLLEDCNKAAKALLERETLRQSTAEPALASRKPGI